MTTEIIDEKEQSEIIKFISDYGTRMFQSGQESVISVSQKAIWEEGYETAISKVLDEIDGRLKSLKKFKEFKLNIVIEELEELKKQLQEL